MCGQTHSGTELTTVDLGFGFEIMISPDHSMVSMMPYTRDARLTRAATWLVRHAQGVKHIPGGGLTEMAYDSACHEMEQALFHDYHELVAEDERENREYVAGLLAKARSEPPEETTASA
jgi:hypothetical protein